MVTKDIMAIKSFSGVGTIDTSHLESSIMALDARVDIIENNSNSYDDTQVNQEIVDLKAIIEGLKGTITILNTASTSGDLNLDTKVDGFLASLNTADEAIKDIHDNRVSFVNTKLDEINTIIADFDKNDIVSINTKITEIDNSIKNIIANGYDDTGLKNRLEVLENKVVILSDNDTLLSDKITALENKVDKDTIYNDSPLKTRVSALESKSDNDTIFDPTDINNKITALENKVDNDTIFNPEAINESIEEIKSSLGNIPMYDTDIEFIASGNTFGFIKDNGLGIPAISYINGNRAYDYKNNNKLGMDVGINAIAKLTLLYKEIGKPDELKSFVPIARSEVVGTTLVPSTSGNIFWAEWLNVSNNQGNYIICSIDGTLKLCQWVGTPASSIDELFTKIANGGDVSEDIAVVHSLVSNDDNIKTISYSDSDTYKIVKTGIYNYRVNNADNTAQTEFTLEFGYTGFVEDSNIIDDGYLDDKILSAIEEINSTDSKVSFSMNGYLHSNTSSQGSSSTYGLRPISQVYFDMGDNQSVSFKNKGGISAFQVRSTLDAPEYVKNMAVWASIPTKDNYSLDATDILLAPVRYNGRFYLVLFTGMPSSNILEQLGSGIVYHNYAGYQGNKLILSEIPTSGEYGYSNRNKYDGSTVVMSMGYANELKKIKCLFKGSHGIPQLKSDTMPELASELGSGTYLFQNDANFLKDGIRWGSYSASYYNEFKMPYPSNDGLFK